MFKDRQQAGRELARALDQRGYGGKNSVVVAIARGGVAVGRALADALGAPLDVVVVKKLGAPGHEELAVGAVGPEGTIYLDWELVTSLHIGETQLAQLYNLRKQEVAEQLKKFRGSRRPRVLSGKIAIVTDDGLATGATFRVALLYIKKQHPKRLVAAIPVAPAESIEEIRKWVDDAVVLTATHNFRSVGQFYDNFNQLGDEEVIKLLKDK